MATHSSILAWEIPWTEEPGGLHSIGSQRVGHNLATKQQQQQQSFRGCRLVSSHVINSSSQDFLVIQWLRLCTSTAGARVHSLVRELRSHMHGQKIKVNWKKKTNPAPAEGNILIYVVTYLKTLGLLPVHPGHKSLPVFPSFPSLAAIILHLTVSLSYITIIWCLLRFSSSGTRINCVHL